MVRPLLQIVHISDLHFQVSDRPPRVEWLLTKTRRFPILRGVVREGIAPYDTKAPRQFENVVKRFISGDLAWNGVTWLVDTGDLTTYGDEASLQRGFDFLSRLRVLCPMAVSLHGNHDAWPGDFPLGVADDELDEHRQRLRDVWFPTTWPEDPLVHDADVVVQLYGLNSVLHCPLRNAFAFGRIDHDRFWDDGRDQPEPDRDLRQLVSLMKAHLTNKPTIRILATHHPLHFPSWPPWDKVSNRQEVAAGLAAQTVPFVQIVLSGHTHALHPPHGRLPATSTPGSCPPLADGQQQLVVGALMQNGEKARAGSTPPHLQAQILRFYWNSVDEVVELRRTLVAKHLSESHYRLINLPGQTVSQESMRIPTA